jgi:predicted metal-binding protein
MALIPVECLGNCRRGCTVSLSVAGGWTYVFGDLAPENAPEIVAAASLLAGSPDGLMPWRGRPEPLKRGMIARLPPLDRMKDAAE